MSDNKIITRADLNTDETIQNLFRIDHIVASKDHLGPQDAHFLLQVVNVQHTYIEALRTGLETTLEDLKVSRERAKHMKKLLESSDTTYNKLVEVIRSWAERTDIVDKCRWEELSDAIWPEIEKIEEEAFTRGQENMLEAGYVLPG